MICFQGFRLQPARFVVVSVGLFWGAMAFASFYPPGYVVENKCHTVGTVEVCALNQHYNSYPRLTVRYTGTLLQESWGRISAFVKLNGRSGLYRMKNFDFAETVRPGEPNPYLCITRDTLNPTVELPSGQFGWCNYTAAPGGGGLTWEVKEIPENETQLYFFARDEFGRANAWDVEVAFVTDSGVWDSLNGDNYRFRFE
jgi:hypothetical protein